MFDSWRQAEVISYRGAQRQAYGYFYEVVQGKRTRGKPFRADEHEAALAKAAKINAELPAKNRRKAIAAAAGTLLLAGGAVVGLSELNNSERLNPDVAAPSTPIPTKVASSTPTASESASPTIAPKDPYKLSPVTITLSPKPHHPHHHHAIPHVTSAPETPAPSYTPSPEPYEPPQPTYTPPPPPPAPTFTVHHLKH